LILRECPNPTVSLILQQIVASFYPPLKIEEKDCQKEYGVTSSIFGGGSKSDSLRA
jgi:hypothetical protein